MATILDPQTGLEFRYCISCGAETYEAGIACPNARDLCIDCCGERH